MRRFRRLSALTMVLTLLLSLSISVWAADYDVETLEDLQEAFNDTSGEDVNINITGDIQADYAACNSQSGVTYTITSENGSHIGFIGFIGNGTVVVDTEVSGDLYSSGNVEMTVTGDINGHLGVTNNSIVTVEGNIDGGLYVNDCTSTSVSGDVEVELYVTDNAEVSVSGDASGYLYFDVFSNTTVGGNAEGDIRATVSAEVTVGGDVNGWVGSSGTSSVQVGGDVNGCADAMDQATINIAGDVNGADGHPDEVDFSDPAGYSDGSVGVYASGDSTVNVGGNVTGGDSYGTFGWGGTGVMAGECATVNVGGNITGGNTTADPETDSEDFTNRGGDAIDADYSATVTVGGSAAGGNTNGSNGYGGNGIWINCYNAEATPGSITVGGSVTGGDGENVGSGIWLDSFYDENSDVPDIAVGSCDSIDGYGFTEEKLEQIKADIEATYTKTYTSEDFFQDILWLIRHAEAGDELTFDFGYYTMMPYEIIEAVREYDVTLIIQWRGGEDLTIDKNFTSEFDEYYVMLADLAKLLKK